MGHVRSLLGGCGTDITCLDTHTHTHTVNQQEVNRKLALEIVWMRKCARLSVSSGALISVAQSTGQHLTDPAGKEEKWKKGFL